MDEWTVEHLVGRCTIMMLCKNNASFDGLMGRSIDGQILCVAVTTNDEEMAIIKI